MKIRQPMTRSVEIFEQPHVLHQELQKAAIVDRFALHGSPGGPDEEAHGMGVPHGTEEVLVLARNVRVKHAEVPQLYFCESHGYRALASSIKGGDEQEYPPYNRTYLGWDCDIPKSGYHTALLRVSLNGSIRVIVDTIGDEAFVIEQANRRAEALATV